MLHIEYAYMTHPGYHRKTNQDNLVCMGTFLPEKHDRTDQPVTGTADTAQRALFGVFDGMGGEEHGEAASFIAAGLAVETDIRNMDDFAVYCRKANSRICEYVRENGIRSSGTTASMLLFDDRGGYSCHIGDSRIYRCDYGIPEQLTHDDVWSAHPGRRNELLQCLGIPEEEMRISPHMDYYPIRCRTVFMLCTDGLSHMLTENRIAAVMSDGGGLEQQTRELMDKALAAGGRDNITLILIEVSPC